MLMIVFVDKFHNLKVLALIVPKLGLRTERGTTKSEVRIIFFSKSTLRPWGENWSARMLTCPARSSGHWPMMSKLALVSIRRPGAVPAAAGKLLACSKNEGKMFDTYIPYR